MKLVVATIANSPCVATLIVAWFFFLNTGAVANANPYVNLVPPSPSTLDEGAWNYKTYLTEENKKNVSHKAVVVELYFDTYCPFCQYMIVEQLYPAWDELRDIMEVRLIPYGNAKYEPSEPGWTFTCQHGPDECKANMIMACAQDYFNGNIHLEMEFVNCLLSAEQPSHAGAICSLNVGVAWEPIERCINSLAGQVLLHNVALKQEKLQSIPGYVPWVLLNDQWLAFPTNLKKDVCEMYNGTTPECNEIIQELSIHSSLQEIPKILKYFLKYKKSGIKKRF